MYLEHCSGDTYSNFCASGTTILYNKCHGYTCIIDVHQSYIEAVDGATDLVGYSSQLSIVGILIEGITEQGDEQRRHAAGGWTFVDLGAGNQTVVRSQERKS